MATLLVVQVCINHYFAFAPPFVLDCKLTSQVHANRTYKLHLDLYIAVHQVWDSGGVPPHWLQARISMIYK